MKKARRIAIKYEYNDIIKYQESLYRDNFCQKGPPKGVFFNNKETQNLRFKILLEDILLNDTSKFSIHDIGAGLADLHTYLIEEK